MGGKKASMAPCFRYIANKRIIIFLSSLLPNLSSYNFFLFSLSDEGLYDWNEPPRCQRAGIQHILWVRMPLQ